MSELFWPRMAALGRVAGEGWHITTHYLRLSRRPVWWFGMEYKVELRSTYSEVPEGQLLWSSDVVWGGYTPRGPARGMWGPEPAPAMPDLNPVPCGNSAFGFRCQ
jgi:hypothetical protein